MEEALSSGILISSVSLEYDGVRDVVGLASVLK